MDLFDDGSVSLPWQSLAWTWKCYANGRKLKYSLNFLNMFYKILYIWIFKSWPFKKFLSGLCLLIGLGRTLNFFWQPHNPSKMKGSAAFFFGIFLVLIGWPFIGMCVEFYGFFVLFSGFLPIVISFIRRIPVLGNLLNLPFIRCEILVV